jgi:glycosyltransferase involved in cell wall biosynthesis
MPDTPEFREGPRVALLVPCHNGSAFIPRLAESARAQLPPFAEWLLYDDGSTDDSAEVARASGFRVLRGPVNRGPGAARNELAAATECAWLHFHDVDDEFIPEFLGEMGGLLDDSTDVAVCDSEWLDSTRTRVLLALRPDARMLASDPIRATLRQGISCNAMVIRRSCFQAVHGFDESLRIWEDADLHVRLAAAGARYRIRRQLLALSIRRAESLSHDYHANWRSRLQVLQGYATRLPTAYLDEVAAQAEIAARELLRLGERKAAAEALELNRRTGGTAPTSANWLMKLLKRTLPGMTVMALQERFRTRTDAGSSRGP